ncbi:MAG: 1-deoxy-D-xylulose-5-phosphate synthase, transketolase [Candidatus Kaiserbacteria bacterium]|nr:1-deoxy-D-xylulose-5-phosphate synthase, transketolase [Candidatus Kaiserbacteria bacterium]
MLFPDAHIQDSWFEAKDQQPTRAGFGKGLVEAADADPRVIALCADLTESTKVDEFKAKYPRRFIEVGVAEQNLAALASGFAASGKIPFMTSYAAFNPGRNNEQIRTTIALNNVPVKVCGMHAGISVGPDGATHQALEDMALMRVIPRMTVISPCDAEEARKATLAAARHDGPVYLRFSREKTPVMTTTDTPFEIGKASLLWHGENPQVTIFATGPLVYNALTVARALGEKGINSIVVNIHTIKPLDDAAVVDFASRSGCVVTVEEHQVAGGLGSAIAECLARSKPLPIEFVGVHDQFGQSGTAEELYAHYKMDVPSIVEAVDRAIARK